LKRSNPEANGKDGCQDGLDRTSVQRVIENTRLSNRTQVQRLMANSRLSRRIRKITESDDEHSNVKMDSVELQSTGSCRHRCQGGLHRTPVQRAVANTRMSRRVGKSQVQDANGKHTDVSADCRERMAECWWRTHRGQHDLDRTSVQRLIMNIRMARLIEERHSETDGERTDA
jgi:hypothetical protein